MNRNWQTLLGLAAGVLVAGSTVGSLVGCSSNAPTTSSRPTAAQLKEGLNVLEMKDPSFGLSAAYVQNGRVVYLETRVGSLKPEVYRNDAPEEPAYEMDMRVVDQNNYTFFAERGGDNYADPSWNADIVRSYTPTAPDTNRALDMEIAHKAATELAAAAPASFKDHVFHLNAFVARANPLTDPTLLQNAAKLAGQARDARGGRGAGLLRNLQQRRLGRGLRVEVVAAHRRGDLVLLRVALGDDHVRLLLGSAGQQLGSGDQRLRPRHVLRRVSNMSADCYSWNSASNVYAGGTTITGEVQGSLTGNNDGTGGCQTAYNWDSGSGSHLCNDDAAYELYQTVHGATNQSGFGINNQAQPLPRQLLRLVSVELRLQLRRQQLLGRLEHAELRRQQPVVDCGERGGLERSAPRCRPLLFWAHRITYTCRRMLGKRARLLLAAAIVGAALFLVLRRDHPPRPAPACAAHCRARRARTAPASITRWPPSSPCRTRRRAPRRARPPTTPSRRRRTSPTRRTSRPSSCAWRRATSSWPGAPQLPPQTQACLSPRYMWKHRADCQGAAPGPSLTGMVELLRRTEPIRQREPIASPAGSHRAVNS